MANSRQEFDGNLLKCNHVNNRILKVQSRISLKVFSLLNEKIIAISRIHFDHCYCLLPTRFNPVAAVQTVSDGTTI